MTQKFSGKIEIAEVL